MVLGIDVSAWQRSISWNGIEKAGVEFGWIKATEGTAYVSPTFERHRNAARRQEIPVGAYHFARPDADDGPLAEADFFLEVARPEPGDLLPVLDFEQGGMGPAKLARWAKAWLARVEKRVGRPPVLYTFSAFWTSTMDNAGGFSRYPLWLANYGSNDGSVHPVRPVGDWPKVTVHQYTSEGRIPGYPGPVDLNRLMRGSTLDEIRLGREIPPAHGYGPPWRLVSKGHVLHEAGRLDDAFLERAADEARASGAVSIRGTARERS